MNKKHVAWLAASVAAVTLIAGCGGNAGTSNNKDAGKNQKTLILGTEATFPLNPSKMIRSSASISI